MRARPNLRISFALILSAILCLVAIKPAVAASDDHVNLQFSPLAIFTNALQVGGEFKLGHSAWSIGPEFLLRSRHSDDTFGLKLRGDYYFSGEAFTPSWYISPIYEYDAYDFKETNSAGSSTRAKHTANSIGVRGGYHWFWRSFNMRLGGGFSLVKPKPYAINYPDGTRADYDGSTYNAASVEYDLGWSF